jgi:multidrug efflux system outer membrane protein
MFLLRASGQKRKNNMNKIIVFLILLVLASGCAVGPRYTRPEIKVSDQYEQAIVNSDSITNLDWWEVYRDSILQSLVQHALDSNLNLMTAVARVEQAAAVLGYNRAQYGPAFGYDVGARASETRDFSEDAGYALSNSSFNLTGNISWELDLWGKIRHVNRAAYAELLASEADMKSVYISLVARTAELYFHLRGLDERMDITRKTFDSRMEFYRIIAQRFEKGDVAELDALQAEQSAAASEAELYNLEREIIIMENAINILLGQPFAPVERGMSNQQQQLPVEIPSGIPSQLLERRPDLQFAEQQLVAQTEKVGVAVAMRFPSLSLTGILGVASPEISTIFDPGAFLGSITGQLTGPLFNFGLNKRRVEIERAAAKQAGYYYEQTVLTAFAEVENSLAEIRTWGLEYNARKAQVAANGKALQLSRALYDNGYTSFLQVLDAEREFFDSQFLESIALQNHHIAVVRLYKALGGGWITSPEENPEQVNSGGQ